MAQRISDTLAERTGAGLVGRQMELRALLDALEEGGPLVVHVHGVGGIGKSRLLAAFAAAARARSATVLELDARWIEPTPDGFAAALGSAAGVSGGVEAIARRLAEVPDRTIVVVDTYELLRNLDAWMRQALLPALPDSVRVVFAGREGPAPGWLAAAEWQGRFRPLQLGLLTHGEALELLAELGMPPAHAVRIERVARGHPLALTVAATLGANRLDRDVDDLAATSVDGIAQAYLAEIHDSATREALEASSVVRRTTEPLLQRMLPQRLPRDAAERLRALPFVETARDGLVVHDAVREAIATALRLTAPERHRAYKVAAWRHLQAELAATPPGTNMWRLTADLLYLLEQPDVRDVFFPPGVQPVTVESARAEDEADYHAIVEAHDGPESLRAMQAWWELAPRTVRMVRDREGAAVGISVFGAAHELDRRLATRDPLAARWFEHYRKSAGNAHAIFVRRWLDRDAGEGISSTYGAFNLDLKRTYVEMRPSLRYVYAGVNLQAIEGTAEVLRHLLWEPLPGGPQRVDDREYDMQLLDMGAGSVEDWLSRIIAHELGVAPTGWRPTVDEATRELSVDGRRVALSALEARFAAYLFAHPGRAVTRAELTERVWRYEGDATSNVIDAVVRGLRRKLGDHAGLVETVRGVGYRYRPGADH